MDDYSHGDICRVCRCEAQPDRPLFYPCICTGSIKYIHQDCLMQWMHYSHKEYCELCGHRFSFQPIYSPDMPRVLPLTDVACGLFNAVVKALRTWLHYSLVGLAWFGIVPLSAYRTYRYLFRASTFDMILSLPLDIFSLENLASDVLRGCFVVTCTLLSFIGLVWLREQILHGGGPDWLEREGDGGGGVDGAGAEEERGPVLVDRPIIGQRLLVEEPEIEDDDRVLVRAPHDLDQRAEEIDRMPRLPDGVELPNAIPEIAPQAVADNDINNDNEPHWNPMEWDRPGEELTWERLLGLDGSLVFLEHVFWIISLNTMFIFTFAFCPYCIGNFALGLLNALHCEKRLMHFHGLVTTLLGYCVIGLILIALHYAARVLYMHRIRWLIGLCYLVVKVSLLSVIEIGVLPLICGWWLDICSLPLFEASLKDRTQNFNTAPGTSLFIHWMFGMVFVYYFAAFIQLLREVIRPGVLWFLRNLNDPDFSPIQEMIHLSIARHIRRFIASAVIFGSTIMLMFWLPIKILKQVWPTFLPYALSGDSEVNELSLQLLLLQIILPGFFEQSHTRAWLKCLLKIWCFSMAWILGIQSYLLGNEGEKNQENPQQQAQAVGEDNPLPEAFREHDHDNYLSQYFLNYSYVRPKLFPLRLLALFLLICLTVIITSIIVLTVPVWIGRKIMNIWLFSNQFTNGLLKDHENKPRPHELYTAALGVYLCWLMMRSISVVAALIPQGHTAIMNKLKAWARVGISYVLPMLVLISMVCIIPLLFGLLLEQVLVIPMRVPFYQSPVHFLWQDWALGVLYSKIAIAIILMGPEWTIKHALERAYRDGLQGLDLKFLIYELGMPIIIFFGLALAIPYILGHSLLPSAIGHLFSPLELSRAIYPVFFLVVSTFTYIYYELKRFQRLYASIKVDKYLVGQRLVNYDHNRPKKLEENDEDSKCNRK